MNIVLCCDFRPLSLPFPFVIFEGFLLAFFSLSFLTLRKSYHVNKLSWTHCCQCPGRINSYEGKKVVFSFFFFSGQHKFLCCVSCRTSHARPEKRNESELNRFDCTRLLAVWRRWHTIAEGQKGSADNVDQMMMTFSYLAYSSSCARSSHLQISTRG